MIIKINITVKSIDLLLTYNLKIPEWALHLDKKNLESRSRKYITGETPYVVTIRCQIYKVIMVFQR